MPPASAAHTAPELPSRAHLSARARPLSVLPVRWPDASPMPPGFHLHAATRAGVGVLQLGERTLNLTAIQLAFVSLLAERRREDHGASAQVAGFAPTAELLEALPWDTSNPDDCNLKALVRRMRGKLSDWPLQIESRRGFGYRLVWLDTQPA